MDFPRQSNLLTSKEAAALTGYVADYITRQCRAGKIVSKQAGRTWLIDKDSLLAYFAAEEKRKEENAKELAREREREYAEAKKRRENAAGEAGALIRESVHVPVLAHPSWFSEEELARPVRGSVAALAMTLLMLCGGLYASHEDARADALALIENVGARTISFTASAVHFATSLENSAARGALLSPVELPAAAAPTFSIYSIPAIPEFNEPAPLRSVARTPALTFSKESLDVVSALWPLAAFGEALQGASSGILTAYARGVNVWVRTTPEVPEKIVATVGNIGYTLASLGNAAPQSVIAYVRSLEGEALGVVGNIALAYDTAKNALSGAYHYAPSKNVAAIGASGSEALRADSSGAQNSMLAASSGAVMEALQGAALFTYETMNGLFKTGGSIIASFFAPKPVAVLVSDEHEEGAAQEPPREAERELDVGVSGAAEAGTPAAPAPLYDEGAKIYNEYYAITTTGVSHEYVEERIKLHMNNLDDRIDERLDNIKENSSRGTVTSVNVSGGATGLSFAGGPITSSGTLTMSGTLSPSNGGTGTSTAPAYGQLLLGNAAGGYDLVATSSLNIVGVGSFAYPFPLNATTTKLDLNGGASTTQLTISGNLYAGTNALFGTTSTIAPFNFAGASTGGYGTLRVTNTNSGTRETLVLARASGTGGTSFVLNNSAASGGRTFEFLTTDSGNSEGAGKLIILNNAVASMTMDSAGNVGIGTTTPVEKLSILSGDNTSSTNIFAVRANNLTQGVGIGYNTIRGLGTNQELTLDTPGTGDLTLATGGGSRLTVDGATGYVGIGTTTPQAPLSVVGIARLSDNSGANSHAALYADTNGLNIEAFNYGNTVKKNVLLTPYGGSVGIGSTTPNTKLVISGTTGTDSTLTIEDTNASGAAALKLVDAGGNNYTMQRDTTTGFLFTSGAQTTFSGYRWRVNGTTDVLTINNSGSVGIGTTTPDSKLNVHGTVTIPNNSYYVMRDTAGAAAAYLYLDTSNVLRIQQSVSNGVTNMTVNGANGYFNFGVQSGSDLMRILGNGNVGIGTTSPAHKLVLGSGTETVGLYISGDSGGIDNTARPSVDTAQLRLGRVGVSNGGGIEFNLSPSGSGYGYKMVANDDGNGGNLNFLRRWNSATWSTMLSLQGSSGNVGIGTSTPVSRFVIYPDSAPSGFGSLLVESGNNENTNTASIEVLGRRSDTNASAAFGGALYLGHMRTDSKLTLQGGSDTYNQLGNVIFGGNHTNSSRGNVLYTASIGGVVEGDFNNSSTMPTGIAFRTGSAGSVQGTGNLEYGTERLRITSAGNVGIGTTTPAEKLNIDSGAAEFALQWNSSGSRAWVLGSASNRMYFRNKTDSSEPLTILNAGNIGIGTTSPVAKLQVSGTTIISGTPDPLYSNIYYNGSTWEYLTSNQPAFVIRRSAINVSELKAFPDGTAGSTVGDGPTIFSWNGSTGSVGVATTTPTGRFNVYGGTAFFDNDSANADQIYIRGSTGTNHNRQLTIGYNTTGNYAALQAVEQGVGYKNLTLNALGGNVGIGLSTLNYKLEVLGTASSTSYRAMQGAPNSADDSARGYAFGGDGDTGIFSLGSGSGAGEFSMYANNTHVAKVTTGAIIPGADNNFNLGSSGNDWGCLYYNSGTLGTCASDERLKDEIEELRFGDALTKIAGLSLRTYEFRAAPGNTYHGLIAQEVEEIAPELVEENSDGFLTVKYGDIQWLTIEALQDLNSLVASLASTSPADTEEGSFVSRFFGNLVSWFADVGNGIGDFVANRVRATELCVTDEEGETCLTRSQLDALLAGAGASDHEDEGGDEEDDEPPAGEPPAEGGESEEEPPVESGEEPGGEEPDDENGSEDEGEDAGDEEEGNSESGDEGGA